jgi:hypothetical protein
VDQSARLVELLTQVRNGIWWYCVTSAIGTVFMMGGAVVMLLRLVAQVKADRKGAKESLFSDVAAVMGHDPFAPFTPETQGPVAVMDWTIYGKHLAVCESCTVDAAGCGHGRRLWQETLRTAQIVTGGGV